MVSHGCRGLGSSIDFATFAGDVTSKPGHVTVYRRDPVGDPVGDSVGTP